MADKIERRPITSAGRDQLNTKLNVLQSEQLDVAVAIASAKEIGDLSENAEYRAAMERKTQLEVEIAEVTVVLSNVYVVLMDEVLKDYVRFGATVSLQTEDEKIVVYTVVGADESDLERGLISISSPLAKALLGKKNDELVEVNGKHYTIVNIQYL